MYDSAEIKLTGGAHLAGSKGKPSLDLKLKLEIENFDFDFPNNKIIAEKIFEGTLDSASKLQPADNLPYFPIEWLKEDGRFSAKLFEKNAVKTFLSSGTTSKQRSKSHFSKDGLFLYKVSALTSFIKVLKDIYGSADQFSGISLIPKTSIWKDSSLAQMIEWFSDYFEIKYLDPELDSKTIIKLLESTHSPLWVFGTAFHFIYLADSIKSRVNLGENIFLFETGGTKGKTRSLTREELYKLLMKNLGLLDWQIASEYGMCELACQAWSYVAKKDRGSQKSYSLPYKFLPHIKLQITKGLSQLESSGVGSLVISDVSRIDIPHSIRTQDICELNENGTFNIISRVPNSVLKGCSLNAEKIVVDKISKNEFQHSSDTISDLNHKKVKSLYKEIKLFLDSDNLLDAFCKEFGSKLISNNAVRDLKLSIPDTLEKFIEALEKASPNKKSYLVLQPGTHSVTSFYPLIFLAAYGINTSLRASDRLEEKFPALDLLIKKLTKYFEFKLYNSNYRIGQSDQKEEAIIAYGSTPTIEAITKASLRPVIGFKEAISVSILNNVTSNNLNNLFKDFYSLNQKGCMSARAAFIPESQKDLFLTLTENLNLSLPLDELNKCALDHETMDLIQKNVSYIKRISNEMPLIPLYDENSFNSLDEIFSNRIHVYPVVFYKSHEQALQKISEVKSIHYISSDETETALAGKTIRMVGQLNISPWDGTHEGIPLLKAKPS